MAKFQLHPFPSNDLLLPAIEIFGQIDRQNELLSIEYQLSGDLDAIAIATPTVPARTDKLWEATCFEFFLGIPGARNYWEFNLSPSGDWNIFQLDDYRQGLREELAVTALPFEIERQPNLLSLSLEFDLSKIIDLSLLAVVPAIEVSVTTVIKPCHGEVSYWAISHCGKDADFHLRESFAIGL
jgi:hypothetical protein